MYHLSTTLAFSEADLVRVLRKHWLLTYRSGGVLRGLMCIPLRGEDALSEQLRTLGQEFEYRCYTPHWTPQSQRLIELDLHLQQLSAAAKDSKDEESAVNLNFAAKLISEFKQLSQQIRDNLVVAQSREIPVPPLMPSSSEIAILAGDVSHW